MKTIKILFIFTLAFVLMMGNSFASEPYFFEDFERFDGLANQGVIPTTDNIIFNKKITPHFGYEFRVHDNKLIPFYGTDGSSPTPIFARMAWYFNNNKIQANSWMVTRQIDLSEAVNPELTFKYACGLYVGNSDFSVKITESFDGLEPESSTWHDCTEESGLKDIEPFGNGVWPNRLSDLKVDLSQYVGKKIYIAFNGITPLDEVTKNPNDALIYIKDVKVAEKPIWAPDVIYEESFSNLPGPHSADFTGYNGWWNGKSDGTNRYFKKRMDTVVYVPRVEHMIWVNHTSQKSAQSWLISPKINLKNAINPELKFNFGIGNNNSDNNFLKIKITDEFEGGAASPTNAIWDDITIQSDIYNESVVKSYTTVQPESFHEVSVSLNDYVGEDIYVCFEYNMPPKSDGSAYTIDAPVYYIDEFKVIEKSTSLKSISDKDLFNITPNTILLSNQVNSIEIYSILGELVKYSNEHHVNVSELSGVYIIKLNCDGRSYNYKIIL